MTDISSSSTLRTRIKKKSAATSKIAAEYHSALCKEADLKNSLLGRPLFSPSQINNGNNQFSLSSGKRYRRQDAIGTPFCVTVDHDSLNDHCVTVRDRDTMAQERVKIEDLPHIIGAKVNMSNLLKKLK